MRLLKIRALSHGWMEELLSAGLTEAYEHTSWVYRFYWANADIADVYVDSRVGSALEEARMALARAKEIMEAKHGITLEKK